jgi:hypothetical protein
MPFMLPFSPAYLERARLDGAAGEYTPGVRLPVAA